MLCVQILEIDLLGNGKTLFKKRDKYYDERCWVRELNLKIQYHLDSSWNKEEIMLKSFNIFLNYS